MSFKKSFFQQICLLTLVLLLSAFFVTQAEAVPFEVVGKDCKDMVNDGIQFISTVSISGTDAEIWRDRIQVNVLDPAGNDYHTVGTDNIKEVVLYPASSNTPYQCQQLTTDTIDNSFSCNSFPAGATIGRVSVRFIPNFDAGKLVIGDYKLSFLNLNTTLEILNGTAKIEAYSSACAWNQGDKAFIPQNPPKFVYNTNTACGGGNVQAFDFLENTASPFTIVSFPLNETVDPARWVIIGSPQINQYNYTLVLLFASGTSYPTPDLALSYYYTAGTDPADTTVNPTAATGFWATATMPIRLIGGTLSIDPGTTPMANMPTLTQFLFSIYYRNIDPTLGYENSTFHLTRNMSMLFSPTCPAQPLKYHTTAPIDPCVPAKQTFSLPFTTAGVGMAMPAGMSGFFQATRNFSNADLRHMYFYTQKCANADCSSRTGVGGDAYIYRVYVKDPESDSRYYHYAGLVGDGLSDIHMKFFGNIADTTLLSMNFTARTAGTYYVRGFYPSKEAKDGFPNTGHFIDFYVTVPEKSGYDSCRSSGTDGIFIAPWDGCKEDHDPQTVEFKVSKEHYGFVSNYSNQKLIFTFNPAISTIPMAANVTELFCDWQILADGYGTGGAVCAPDRIELPPMTRAIVKGGKINFSQRPKISDKGDEYEYVLAYQRTASADNMNLLIDVQYQPCPQEKIPETGYSLRSPQPMSPAAANEFVFTGNTIQIPAIGLGMEYPIPIVHVYYKDGDLANGWDLSMLGGYIGELEGGAYIPYGGNAVLTGHYYSQGVFVNLMNMRFEDEIIVYATDGMKYIYKVTNSFWTKPNDMYTMFQPNGEKSLTLVTCDKYNFINDEYEKRYIVQATLESSEPYQH